MLPFEVGLQLWLLEFRGGGHVALGLVVGVMGMDVYAMVGREGRGPLVVFGKLGYHVALHCVLLLTASWWVS